MNLIGRFMSKYHLVKAIYRNVLFVVDFCILKSYMASRKGE